MKNIIVISGGRAWILSIDLCSSDKQLLHQLVPLGVFFFHFFDAVFLVDVGFFEFLRQRSDVFARGPEAALLDQFLPLIDAPPDRILARIESLWF